ncbi:hypothetical protein PILCRDRAFT_815806 [Piloderma croceum F 1598]|uniref:O-methyltransferase C-terminal domain-containing protein n=1 Tax=Piloderma croceum (strain F 1598) TaxID=765440 RepID=A0A0C3BJP0_PILCF|nr:hypothetical protein PILCRDRAFT_815806 [Piloderma croceum F 1598]
MTTFEVLHTIVGDALDDIERVFADAVPLTAPSTPPTMMTTGYTTPPTSPHESPVHTPSDVHIHFQTPTPRTSPPSSPSTPTPKASTRVFPSSKSWSGLDFPSLDFPAPLASFLPSTTPATPKTQTQSPKRGTDSGINAEQLISTSPTIGAAINRIVSACGQISATVRDPFLSLCDASLGYHLPSCLRFLETTHTVEILREAGEGGLHVSEIAKRNGTDIGKCAHILRLLSTHHILREVKPDVFANNRISALMDSGKEVRKLVKFGRDGCPEKKYEGTNGVAAFVGLNTDELFKASAYLTEAYVLNDATKFSTQPTETPFNFAFGTKKGFFGWLEEVGEVDGEQEGEGACEEGVWLKGSRGEISVGKDVGGGRGNKFRLERFGKAMSGSCAWDPPGGLLNAGIDWSALPAGSTIVDVGGGIGSTSMGLAKAFGHLRFVVQDRGVVVDMGVKTWKERVPELLTSGTARFQAHDFFNPQPVLDASIFLLRVVLHDWPDSFARKILLRLREAAVIPSASSLSTSDGDVGGLAGGRATTLIIADHVLPLACVDDFEVDGEESVVEGAERMLASPPLLANLGKASANAYNMDMTMQVTFNAKERTLREIVALALSAGWKVTKVTRAQGSLFGYILAVPVDIPVQVDDDQDQNLSECARSVSVSAPAVVTVADADNDAGVREEPRIDTPTFALTSNVDLRSVTADSISTSISTTTSAAAAAALGHRSGRGWGIMRKVSSPLVGRLRPGPSNVDLNMGVESNSESSQSREGLSESTCGGGRDDNINERRGSTLKKKGSLASFPRSSSLDYCFSHRS